MMAEAEAPGVPPKEAPELLDKATYYLEQFLGLGLKQFVLCLISIGVAFFLGGLYSTRNAEDKETSAIAKERQVAAAQRESLEKELHELRSKAVVDTQDIAKLKGENDRLKADNVNFAQLAKDKEAALTAERESRKSLEETILIEPARLQLSQEEFLRKAESMEDSPVQEHFRNSCKNKGIVKWHCTFDGTIEGRALKVRFDDSGFYAICFLSDPKLVPGFELTPIGTRLKFIKGRIEHVNVGYMQARDCQIER